MGKLFEIGPVVMEIEALKVEKNRDFSWNPHPGDTYSIDIISIGVQNFWILIKNGDI